MSYSKIWAPHVEIVQFRKMMPCCIFIESVISRLLAEEFKVFNKTPKKCRQRFNNHLNPIINRQQWLQADEKALVGLQSQMGNKWAEISRKLAGRTDNSVKNKFYSIFRKSVRLINEIIRKKQKTKTKILSMSFVYKLIAVVDKKFSPNFTISKDLICRAEQLKNNIIKYGFQEQNQIDNEEENIQKIIEEVQWVNCSFKKKVLAKKKRVASKGKDKKRRPQTSIQSIPSNTKEEESMSKSLPIIFMQDQDFDISPIEGISELFPSKIKEQQEQIYMMRFSSQEQSQQIDAVDYMEMKSFKPLSIYDLS